MKKRVFAMLLAIVMLIGAMPMSAFAAEATGQAATSCETEGCTYAPGHEGDCSNAIASVDGTGPVLNVMVNASSNAANSDPAKAVLGQDGILRIENRTQTMRYVWLGTEDGASVTEFKILQGLGPNNITPSANKRTSNNVFEGTTYQAYYYSGKYTLPLVAKATVTAADGVTAASYYLIVAAGAADGQYVVSADGFTADSETYYKTETGISFTQADQKVTLTPTTTGIGSGTAQELTWTWTTSDPTVAIVDANGTVTSIGGGEATITATCQQLSVSCTVTSTAAAHNLHTYADGACSVCGTQEPTARKAYFTLVGQDGRFAMAKDNTTELYKAQLTVSDADMDGTLTLNDAFLAAHAAYSANGTDDFTTVPSTYGPYIVEMWGVQTGNVSYYVNDAAANGLTDALKSNAELTVYFVQDAAYWSDLYTYFAADSYKAVEDKAQTITVKAVNSGKEVAPKGADVTVYDSTGKAVEALATTVGEDGTFCVTFPDTGTYTVEVSGKASYTGSAWDTATGGYVDKAFADAAVVLSRTTVQVYAYVTKTVYVTASLKTGDFAVGKSGDEIYRLALRVEDDQTDPDGQVDLVEVGAALHAQHHPDGISAYSASTSWIAKFWGDTSGSFGYYLNDTYMDGSGTNTGTNGRPFQDKLMGTVVEDGDCFSFYIYQSSNWSDKYTYFAPVAETATVGEAKSLKAYCVTWGTVGAPSGAAIKVTDSKGVEQTDLNTTVGSDGTFSITFPAADTYTVELRSNGSQYFVPSRCAVTVEPVKADGVSLNMQTASMTVGQEALTLTATVTPDNAADKTVTWSSSDETVATVDAGKVTALKAGTAVITATTANGKSASCAVTVTEQTAKLSVLKFASGSSAAAAPYAMTPAFDPAVTQYTVVVPDSTSSVYAWATLGEGDSGSIVASYKSTGAADKTVTLTSGKATGTSLSQAVASGKLAGNTVTIQVGDKTEYTVKIVRQATLSKLAITADEADVTLTPKFGAAQFAYSADIAHDAVLSVTPTAKCTDAVVTVNGGTQTSVTPVWNDRSSDLVIKVSGGEGTVDSTYTVHLAQLATKIEILTPPAKTAYAAGESFDPTGMTLKATYSDGFTEPIEKDAYTYAPAGPMSQSISEIDVTFDGLSAKQPITVSAVFEGKGTQAEPYLIKTAEDLVRLSDLVAGGVSFSGEYFKMVNPITLPDAEGDDAWVPVGVDASKPFSGNFDGGGNLLTVPAGGLPLIGTPKGASLSNLDIYGSKIAGYGVVNNYCQVGKTHAITIENVTLKSGTQTLMAGFIGGYASGSDTVTIRSCTVEKGVIVGYDKSQKWVGSFAGEFNGTIENCVSYATVYGTDFVGGIVSNKGQSIGTFTVSNCHFYGNVIATGNYVGGIVGHGYGGTGWGFTNNAGIPTIENCTATGSVSGANYVGGIYGGDAGVVQVWDNAAGSIANNTFTGTVSATGGEYVGAIIGYLKSLNKNNDIKNNTYAASCGAAKGIGFVQYVDTSCATHETTSGATYFNTAEGKPGITGVIKTNLNRTDDPLGADAQKLCRSDAQLNPVAVELKISGSYKTEYITGEKLDLSGMVLTVVYSNKSEKTVDLSNATVTGYDANTVGKQKLTVTYNGLTASVTVTVRNPAGTIKVTVSILGDRKHDSDTDGKVHTLANGGLTTWVKATTYTVDSNASVWDVLKLVFEDKGLPYTYSWSAMYGSYYIESVNGLGEFDNGQNSGWLWVLNGAEGNVGISNQYLKDGDKLIFHYTDDYSKEREDQDGNDGEKDAKAAETVEKLIDAIGTVTLDSAEKIKAARKAYDGLTYAQKQLVDNYAALTAAETKYAQLKAVDDEEKAEAVEDLIDAIKEGSATFADDVRAAQKAYSKLTADQKKLVGNYSKLTEALKKLASEEDVAAAHAVEKLIGDLGTVTLDSEDAVKAAREAYGKLTDGQKELVENLTALEAAEEKLAELKALAGVADIYKTTGDYMESLGTPVPGGEWMVIGLIRSGREIPGADAYYAGIVQYVQENIDENERLHSAKSSDSSRIILALTALGKDVTNVGGHDLLKGLSDMAFIQKQGINGPIWALIALDSGNYPVPVGGDVTRQALIQVILDAQLADGGWALSGSTSDADVTGMAVQALAPYYNSSADVKKAVDAAIETLSVLQAADGSYGSTDGASSESIAQVIVALAALGIDADTDARFIKNGISAVDALCAYYVQGGGFKHLMDGSRDGMATEQGYYALAAYFRMLDGKTGLYDMTDVIDLGGDVSAQAPAQTLPADTDDAKGSFPWWILLVVLAAGVTVAVVVPVIRKKRK